MARATAPAFLLLCPCDDARWHGKESPTKGMIDRMSWGAVTTINDGQTEREGRFNDDGGQLIPGAGGDVDDMPREAEGGGGSQKKFFLLVL